MRALRTCVRAFVPRESDGDGAGREEEIRLVHRTRREREAQTRESRVGRGRAGVRARRGGLAMGEREEI